MDNYSEPFKLEIRKKLADKIIKLRQAKKMSSEKLAYSIGVSKTGLRYIERCEKDPKLSTLALIADGLDISLKELFDF